MRPHLPTYTHSRLCLIYNERNTFLSSNISNLFIEVGCSLIVAQCSYWFYNYSTDHTIVLLPLMNNILKLLQAFIFLSSILMLILSHGVLEAGEGGNGPIKSTNFVVVEDILITY